MFERTVQGTVSVVNGPDAIIASNCDAVRSVLSECVSRGQPRLVLNLNHVPLIDSAGLDLLLEISERCMDRGGSMQLAAPNALCADILRITGVGERFVIFEDVSDAVRSFSR